MIGRLRPIARPTLSIISMFVPNKTSVPTITCMVYCLNICSHCDVPEALFARRKNDLLFIPENVDSQMIYFSYRSIHWMSDWKYMKPSIIGHYCDSSHGCSHISTKSEVPIGSQAKRE